MKRCRKREQEEEDEPPKQTHRRRGSGSTVAPLWSRPFTRAFNTSVRKEAPGSPQRPPGGADLSTVPIVTPLLSGAGALIEAELSVSLIGYRLQQMTGNLFGRAVIGGLLEAAAHERQRRSAGKLTKERTLIKLRSASSVPPSGRKSSRVIFHLQYL